ncbi:MAG: chemotaxis protein CheW, partial [Myxococcota bacterium]
VASARDRAVLEARAKELARAIAPEEADGAREVLRFTRGAEALAIEVRHVCGVTRPVDITPVFGLPPLWVGVFAHRGEVVAVVDPARLSPVAAPPAPAGPLVLVLGDEQVELGLLVDAAHDIVRLRADEVLPAPRVADGPPLLGVTAEGTALLDGAGLLGDARLFVGPGSAP